MIWDNNITIIVMFSGLDQNSKRKVQKYWPIENEVQAFGDVEVTSAKEIVHGAFIKRDLVAQSQNERRSVTQFQYTSWCDHDVPRTTSGLHRLLEKINEAKIQNSARNIPVIVLSSLDGGQSGAFIAYCNLVSDLERTDKFNAYKYVTEMCRNTEEIIKTEAQYILLHKLITEYTLLKDTSFDVKNLKRKVGNLERKSKNGITECEYEIELLSTLQAMHLTSEKASNDRFSVCMPMHEGHQIIYNASFIEAYDTPDKILAAEGPSIRNIAEFWLLVLENDVKTIVMLNQETETARKQYWPDQKGAQKDYSSEIGVTLVDQQDISENIIMRSILVTKGNKKVTIKHYQYTQWHKRDVPRNTDEIIKLVAMMKSSLIRDGGLPLVHSGDGIGRTGTFLAISNLIDSLKTDDKIDVVKTVKDLRDQRPNMVQNKIQYRFIYKVLQDYVENIETYASNC